MLILTRRPGENVYLILPDGRKIKVTFCGTEKGQTRIGFTADQDITILREEVWIREEIEKVKEVYRKQA